MIQVAVVGCGAAFRELHHPWLCLLERRGQIEVSALIDNDLKRAEFLCREYKNARAFSVLKEVFQSTSPQLTIVASPPGFHKDHCIEAMQAGCHVLCEKPLATSLSEAKEMMAVSDTTKRLLAVGMSRRFFPSVSEAATLIRNGKIGGNLEFVCREGGGYGWPVATDGPFKRQSAGGGVLIDRGVHVLDTLQALLGEPSLESSFDDSLRDGVEANSLVWLRCGSARGSVQLSWENSYCNGLVIRGEAGTLKLDSSDHLHYWHRSGNGDWVRVRSQKKWPIGVAVNSPVSLPESYESCIYFEIVQVLRSILLGEPYPVLAKDALKIIGVIEEAYKMAQPLPANWLPESEQRLRVERHWRSSR